MLLCCLWVEEALGAKLEVANSAHCHQIDPRVLVHFQMTAAVVAHSLLDLLIFLSDLLGRRQKCCVFSFQVFSGVNHAMRDYLK